MIRYLNPLVNCLCAFVSKPYIKDKLVWQKDLTKYLKETKGLKVTKVFIRYGRQVEITFNKAIPSAGYKSVIVYSLVKGQQLE